MRLLLHTCCGPCTLYPVSALRAEGVEVTGYFYNPNIHPFKEFERRVEALETVASACGLSMVWDPEGYGLRPWLAALAGVYDPQGRCPTCYRIRLSATAQKARGLGFSAFSTTLLFSRYQRHDLIRELGEALARDHGVPFLYRDFREGWEEGGASAKAIGIYRQPYCGCIFSEEERYARKTPGLNGGVAAALTRRRTLSRREAAVDGEVCP